MPSGQGSARARETPLAAFAGPGEVRALCRTIDWAATPLGAVDAWPPSLRTAVDLCLGSAFATFVWWGPELVQLYNDAALAIVRAKHPAGIAAPARRVWSEVWPDVGFLVEHVLTTGEPARGEDLEVRPERGGNGEPAWFTFSYSALRDEAGDITGMFITAIETTSKVRAERRLSSATTRAGLSADFRALFEAAPTPYLVLAPPDFAIVAVNDAYLRTTMTERSMIVGRALFDLFPDNLDDSTATGVVNLRASLERVLATRRTDTVAVQKYDIKRPPPLGGGFEERWWSPMNVPVLDTSGEIALIIHRVEDVTEIMRLKSAGATQDRHAQEQQSLIDRLREANEAAVRAVERARDSEERLSMALETALMGTYSWTSDGHGRGVAEMSNEVFGLIPERPLTTTDESIGLIHPEDRARRQEIVDRASSRGEDFHSIYRIVRPRDGRVAWIEERGRSSRDPATGVTSLRGVHWEVTEREQALEALQQGEARQAFLLALTDALRPLSDPAAIEGAAARAIGLHLGVSRAAYVELMDDGDTALVRQDYADGLPTVAGQWLCADLSSEQKDYLLALRGGNTIRIVDADVNPDFDAGRRAKYHAAGMRACLAVPLVKDARHVGTLVVIHSEPRDWTDAEVALVEKVAERTWAAVERTRAESARQGLVEAQRAAIQRNDFRRQLAQVEEEERRRLSLELHDEAGQHLAALSLGLQALTDIAQPGSEVDRRAGQLISLANTLGRELHAVAVRLRPRALDDFGLEAAVSVYAEEWSRQHGIRMSVHAPTNAQRLPSPVENAAFRVVQEALTNIARRRSATHASVLVERLTHTVVVVVEDDGKGFDPKSESTAAEGAVDLALLGIRERVALVGGTVELEPGARHGLSLYVTIPLDVSADAP